MGGGLTLVQQGRFRSTHGIATGLQRSSYCASGETGQPAADDGVDST